MSLRAVKADLLETKPTIEGAGVKLQRAFGFGKTKSSIRSCCWTISATKIPPTTWPDSRGIPIAASRPSPTCWPAKWRTATAWATRAA